MGEISQDEVQALRQRNRALETLNAIAATVHGSLELRNRLDAALTQTLEFIGFDAGAIYLLDASQNLTLHTQRYRDTEPGSSHYGIPPVPTLSRAQLGSMSAPLFLSEKQIGTHPFRQHLLQHYPGVRAALLIPLRSKGEMIGLMSLVTHKELTDPAALNVDTLAAIGDQVGIAVENARLFEAERQAHQATATLRQALTVVTSTLELSEVLSRVLEQLACVVAYDSAAVMLLTEDGFNTLLSKRIGQKREEKRQHTAVPFYERKAAWRVTQERKPIILPDVTLSADWTAVDKMRYIRSWAGIPLVIRDEVIGVLTVDKVEPDYYNEEHLELLQAFAHQVSLAIENARLYETVRQELAERTTLYEVARAVSSTLDLKTVLQTVLDEAIRATGAERGYLVFREEETGAMVPYVARNLDQATITGADFQMSRTIVEQVATSGEPILTINAKEDPRFAKRPSVITYGLRSVLCVPLVGKGQIIGVVYLDNHLKAGQFEQRDLNLLTAIASQAATAIENAMLYERLKQTNQQLARKIDEVNKAYAQLQAMQEQLIKAEKRAAIVELAGATAHELNQPLTVLQGLATLLTSDVEEGSRLWQDLQTIKEATARAAEIVRRLSKITSYETKPYVGGARIIDLARAAGEAPAGGQGGGAEPPTATGDGGV